MYSSKRDIHALVSLIRAHGVTHVVACPGSRNAVIINDMNECRFNLHPVTDERSAGFVALGLALSTCSPVAVCVTSGSALLNLLPAVAEAYYRNIPILVISADRPARYIDTWDGQTIQALLVKVSPRILFGAIPSASILAIRKVMTLVLPVPAPARTSTGPRCLAAAARCSLFNWLKISCEVIKTYCSNLKSFAAFR